MATFKPVVSKFTSHLNSKKDNSITFSLSEGVTSTRPYILQVTSEKGTELLSLGFLDLDSALEFQHILGFTIRYTEWFMYCGTSGDDLHGRDFDKDNYGKGTLPKTQQEDMDDIMEIVKIHLK